MKISSASKKVLASALSAAMVVAFAPTVALGATPAKVIIDADGGSASVTEYAGAVQGGTITLGTATKTGYTFTGWWYDYDGDGIQDDGGVDGEGKELYDRNADFKIPAGKAEVTIKALYAAPTLGAVELTRDHGYDNDKKELSAVITVKDVDLSNKANLKKDATYTLSVKNPNGVVVGTKVYEPVTEEGDNKGYAVNDKANVVVNFTKSTDSTDKLNADLDYLVGGTYTIELSDGTTTVAKKELKLVKMTLLDTDGKLVSTTHFAEGADASAAFDGKTYVDADGVAVTATTALKGDVTFKQAAAAADFTVTGGNYDAQARSLTFGVDITTEVSDTVSYTANLVDPSGATIYTQKVTADGNVVVSFDQASALSRVNAGATEKAGTYFLVVTKNDTTSATAAATDVKGKIVLSEVKLDAGANGAFKSTVKAENTDFFTSAAALTADNITTFDGYVEAASGYGLKEWQINGKAFNAAKNNIKAGEVNTLTAVYSASTTVAAPTVVSATYDAAKKEFTVKLACATAGAKIQVTKNNADYIDYIDANGFTFAKAIDAGKVKVKGVQVKGSSADTLTGDSNPVELAWSTADFDNMVKGGGSKLEKYIGKTKVKWLEQDGIKAAIAAGQAALDAQLVDTKDNWTKLIKAQDKAVFEAVYAFATAELAKYADEAPVVVGDKAYYVKAADLKTATEAVANANKTASAANADAATYATQANNIVTAVNTAIADKAVESKLTAADIQAAAAVTAQLQAAKTGAEAQAAIKAFEALTDAQKQLVSATDVAAAQEIAAAAELKDAQDDAAVSKARNTSKTVKAGKNGKTTKKQSVTLKKITSASGAKVTYKKVSGKKAITVKSGKAYLAKGVKKGTYKATVKATCGTQTAKITVKFVVK